MKRLTLALVLMAVALGSHAEDRSATAEARSEAANRSAPTGSRIQRLPDITVIPGAVGRHTGSSDRSGRKPLQADEHDFLDGKA